MAGEGYHSNAWWNRHPEKPRPTRNAKALPSKPAKKQSPKQRPESREKRAALFTTLGVAAGFGSWGYFVISPSPTVYFGSGLILVALFCCAIAFWEYFEWHLKYRVPVLVGSLLVCSTGGFYWVRSATRPSFTFMVPGVALNGNSWDFIVNHRGPKSSESVQIMFVDLDKRDAILAKHQTTLTSQDIDSYQRVLSLPEVNPKGRGQIFAQQFIWTPLNLDHEHYEIAVTAKDRNLRQELQVENVEGKWVWATQIEDTESGAQLLSCKDPDFPYGAKARIRCFPEVSGYAD